MGFSARIQEWVAISTSRGSSWPKDWTHLSYISCIGWQVSLPLAPPGKPINHGISGLRLPPHSTGKGFSGDAQHLDWPEHHQTHPLRVLHFASIVFSTFFICQETSHSFPFLESGEWMQCMNHTFCFIGTLGTLFEGACLLFSTTDWLINFPVLLFCDLWFVFVRQFEF